MKKIEKILLVIVFLMAACTLSAPAQAATKEYKAKVAQARQYAESDPGTMQLTTGKLTFKKPGQAFGIKLYQADKYAYRGWRLVSAFTLTPNVIEVSRQDRLAGSFRIKALAPTSEDGITLVAYFKNKYTGRRVYLPLNIVIEEDKEEDDNKKDEEDKKDEETDPIPNPPTPTPNPQPTPVPPYPYPPFDDTNDDKDKDEGNKNPGGNPIQPPVVNPGEDLPSVNPKPENPGTTTPPAITTPPAVIVTPPAIELIEVDQSGWRIVDGNSVYDGNEHASSMEGVQSNIIVRREIKDAAGNVVDQAINTGNYTTVFYFDVPEGYKEVKPRTVEFIIAKRTPAVKLAYDETTNSVRVVSEILDTDIENLSMQLDGTDVGATSVSLAGRDLGQHRVSASLSIKGDKVQNYETSDADFRLSGLYNIENQHAWARFSAVPTRNGNQVVVTLYAEGIQIPKGTARATTVVTTAMKVLYDDTALEAISKSDGVSSSGWHTSYTPSDGAYDLTSYHVGTVSADQRYILGTITFNITGDPGENGIRIRLADTFINVDGDKTNPFYYNVDSRVVTVVPPENYSDGDVVVNKNDSLSVDYKKNTSDANKESGLENLKDFIQNSYGEDISISIENQ